MGLLWSKEVAPQNLSVEETDSNVDETDSNVDETDSNVDETDSNVDETDSNVDKMDRNVDSDIQTPWDLSSLQDKLLCHPLLVDVRVKVKQQTSDSNSEEESFSHEQLVHFTGNMSQELCDDLSDALKIHKDEKTHIILVVDNSGSMSGSAFRQIQTALIDIVGQCLDNSTKVVDIILYNITAKTISFDTENYKYVINKLCANGVTNFKAAFDEIEFLMKAEKHEYLSHTVILFMTDGRDTVSTQTDLDKSVVKWSHFLQDYNQQVTVHAVGFSADHDLQFLTRISEAGNQTGMYRYCEPGDGPEALKDKLEELFDYVSSGQRVLFEVTLLHEDNKLLLTQSQSGTFEGTISLVENVNGTKDMIATGECWIYVSDVASLPEISLRISKSFKKNKMNYTLPILCKVRNVSRTVVTDAGGKLLWDLSVLSRSTELLTSELADSIIAGQDVEKLKRRIDHIQASVSSTQVFKTRYDKATRENIMEMISDIQEKLDSLHAMLSQYLRREAKNVSLLARAEDLKFSAQFSKSRRQRLMDRRVARNFNTVKSHALKSAVASEESLRSLTDDALNFYFCVLYMSSVKDILMDPSDLENAIGIGLAVARPEHVVDDPTSLCVYSISGSLVSRSSVMDALKYKISMTNPLSAHGGFSFVSMYQSELSYATFGASREPINAWLPLYVCPAHWERVKSCLQPSLGYLCTLDPFGYSDQQLDIFFMILGVMIGQLWETEVGENQLKLIFALQRTCQACIEEFKLQNMITDRVKEFLESPMGRFRHSISNLYTLIGYLVSLPASLTRRLLGVSDEKICDMSSYSTLWLAFITESLRRASSAKSEIHRDENTTLSLFNMLLHGQADKASKLEFLVGEQPDLCLGHINWMLASNKRRDVDVFVIPEYDPKKDVKAPQIAVQHSSMVDTAMEIWAQAQCKVNAVQNHTEEEIANAKKVVQEWITEIQENTGFTLKGDEPSEIGTSIASEKSVEVPPCSEASRSFHENTTINLVQEEVKRKAEKFDSTAINSSIIDTSAKLLSQLSRHTYPPLSTLPGCLGFLHHYLSNNLRHEQMDAAGGMPPQHWIDGVKKTVGQVFKEIAEYQNKCEKSYSAHRRDGDKDNNLEPHKDSQDNERENEQESDYDSGDEDTVIEYWKTVSRAKNQRIVTVPMLLSLIGIDNGNLQVQLIRAMICQAINYSSNKQARDATLSGELVDLAVHKGEYSHKYLCSVEAKLVESKEIMFRKIAQKTAWEIGNMCMLKAESVWAFVGYLMKTYQDHGEGFSLLIDSILSCSDVHAFPLLADKIRVLFMGMYQGAVVFAKGNVWTPEKAKSTRFEALLGNEVWSDIKTELLSNIGIHVYRKSDKPNRHGHCNSNPYIPNQLREILGMPIIDEQLRLENKCQKVK